MRQHFDGDEAVEGLLSGTEDGAHAALTLEAEDVIMRKTSRMLSTVGTFQ